MTNQQYQEAREAGKFAHSKGEKWSTNPFLEEGKTSELFEAWSNGWFTQEFIVCHKLGY